MNIFLGIDLGTTGLKVTLLTEMGEIIAVEYCEYPILSPLPGYAEQEPLAWWNGFVNACQALNQGYPTEFAAVAGIGICGQMHTQVYLDQDNQILRPAITWMDQRASGIVDRIQQDQAARGLVFSETQNFATTTYTAPQIQWVIENQPEVWQKVSKVLIAKDFIKFTHCTDIFNHSAEKSI